MNQTSALDNLPVSQFRRFVLYTSAAIISGLGAVGAEATLGAVFLLIFCPAFGGAVGSLRARSSSGVILGLAGLVLGLFLAMFFLPAIQVAR